MAVGDTGSGAIAGLYAGVCLVGHVVIARGVGRGINAAVGGDVCLGISSMEQADDSCCEQEERLS